MKQLKNTLLLSLCLINVSLFAQIKLTGIVLDELNTPLTGADINIKGTALGTTTNFNGEFTLEYSKELHGELTIYYMGYKNETVPFNKSTNFGNIILTPAANTLEEIIITASGVIDLAEGRKTPVAVSTIKSDYIKEKSAYYDLPELLVSTPSVQAVQGGGYGDSEMFLRGFDQSNTAFLINGQPINGMEDGKMYWSNWSGVLDIANALQVQRGLGSSKLAISSVGGTVNIITKTIDKKQGGFVQGIIANNNYYKGTLYYNTGLMKNHFAVATMFGYWQGEGWRNGTKGQGQTYYISLGYQPSSSHTFNFFITGAPQWHGDSWELTLQEYLNSKHGGKLNIYYGTKNGKIHPGLINFYHKPISNLTWDFNINPRSSISTVLYGSLGRGGYAYMEGKAYDLITSQDGDMDWDSLIKSNNQAGKPEGFQKGLYNGHNWYGLVANFETKPNEDISINLGTDLRIYKGIHFIGVVDLMGAYGFNTNSKFSGNYTVNNSYAGFNPWGTIFNWNNDHKQRYAYDYEEDINYYGIFGQIEYTNNKLSTFFQGAVSNQNHLATDFYNYDSEKKSENINNIGYNLKGGIGYKINNNTIFGNIGYYSRQPFHDNLYDNLRHSIELDPFANTNEEIFGVELGHTLNSDIFNININLYYTKWGNRSITTSDADYKYNFHLSNVNETHKGAELDLSIIPLSRLKILGFCCFGDWKYGEKPNVKIFENESNQNITNTYQGTIVGNYVKGSYIDNVPQISTGLGIEWKIINNLKFDTNYRYYDKLYAINQTELPAYSLIDTGLSYKLPIKRCNLNFAFNIKNLFDEFYISKSKGVDTPSGTLWNGVDTGHNVRIGYGRTWSFSTKLNF